ncbi:RHS repeat protein [Exilibacterium tricleocarpae]|uniref:RHS repeat protein n=1 Tax=Exilibacterium tricleocarpae TaxID=2591008 RepID=A0A545TQE3_9GAMM|nr:RHS repeat domain-containing protein [Exilibacterium tricleocarpae]TQV79449.1 RHS repeat protein [Exilibacterium tricleocarpae]
MNGTDMMKLPFRKALVVVAFLGLASGVAASGNQAWHYTYNAVGLVTSEDGPRTDVADTTSYSYDAHWNMRSITDALGHTTQLQDYNSRGLPGKIIDANGVETLLTYHVRGWLASSTVKHPSGNAALDAVTRYDYDEAGNRTQVTSPDGSVLRYEYDANSRLTGIASGLDGRIEYTLDAAGNRLEEVIKTGTEAVTTVSYDADGYISTITTLGSGPVVFKATRVFDELSRVIKTVGAAAQTRQFGYDVNGNVIQQIDGKENTTGQVYDALDRIATVTDPLLHNVKYTYDGLDRIASVEDQRGLVTRYVYDAFDNVVRLESPDTGITHFTYDNAGNRLTQTDARGVVTHYHYDALNRVIQSHSPGDATATVTYTYDDTANGNYGRGRLTGLVDSSGESRYRYDHRGNVIEHTRIRDGHTYTVTYQYNLADQVTQMTYPDGGEVTYSYDMAGRINGVDTRAGGTTTTLLSDVDYLPFGPVIAMRYGNGLNYSAVYDQDYRLSQLAIGTLGEVQDTLYQYDANNNITGMTDGNDASQNQLFDYDPLDRLASASGGYGNRLYQYDATGNRITLTDNGTDTYYLYDAASNQLLTEGQWQYSYDENGNTASKTWAINQGTFWAYNTRNRLSRVVVKSLDAQGQVVETELARYTYNALGQRTAKTVAGVTTHYLYGLDGQLIAEADGSSGAVSARYVYVDGQPLAYSVAGAIYTVHTDHLATPKYLTDASGQVVWSARAKPFGEAVVDEDPDGDGVTVVMPLRFPGQYFDQETGLHYNYYRDYDPTIGRYIQSDPIGISEDYSDPQLQVALLQGIPLAAGGTSTALNHVYGYVKQNPLSYIDPFGLSPGGSSGDSDSGKQCGDKKKPDCKKRCKWVPTAKGLKAICMTLCVAVSQPMDDVKKPGRVGPDPFPGSSQPRERRPRPPIKPPEKE